MPQAVRAHARAVAVMMLVMAGAMLGMWLPIPGGAHRRLRHFGRWGRAPTGGRLPRADDAPEERRARWLGRRCRGASMTSSIRAGLARRGLVLADRDVELPAHLLTSCTEAGWGEAGQRFAVTTGGRDASGGAATRRGDGQAQSRPRRAGAAGGPARAPEQARRPAQVEQPRPARGKEPPGDRARGSRRHRWSRRRAGHQRFRGQRAACWSTCGAAFFLAGPGCSARAGYSCFGAQRWKALGGRSSGGMKQRSHCERAGSRDSHFEQRDGLGMPSS